MNSFNASPYATMGFKETATAVKGEPLPIMCVPLHAYHEPIHSSMA
jgi:hypothetical protein